MIDRMTGLDATLWHLERPYVSPHTLKTAILDPSGLGRQLRLDDISRAFEPRLGLVPRATQRVMWAPGFPARPFWIPAADFRIADHLDEVSLPAPGGRDELDALHAELVIRPMPHDRPLWAATLVHGLAGGNQALVLRVHHAVADGMGALNMFVRLTSNEPSGPVPVAAAAPVETVSPAALRREMMREVPSLLRNAGSLARDAVASRRRARGFRRDHPDLPSMLGAPRNFTSRGESAERVCGSWSLDFAQVRAVARAAGVTVNGVYHALIAAALRDELLARGQDTTHPTVASFAVAIDPSDNLRVQGNFVTPTVVNMYSDVADPVERLRQTARSCREGVELRNLTGLKMAGRWSTFTCRLAPLFLRTMADLSPRVVNHVTTANVPGPTSIRYAGPVAVVDWMSLVFTVHPSNLNITAYSYAGHLSLGLVTTPLVLPQPRRFLERMGAELEVLTEALAVSRPSHASKLLDLTPSPSAPEGPSSVARGHP